MLLIVTRISALNSNALDSHVHGRAPKTVLRVVSVFFILCRNVILWTFFISAVFDTIRPNLFYI